MKDVRVIGHIVSDTMGLALITRDGVEMELKAQGWTPQEK
jgi:thiamine-monophosphate kinase